MIPKRMFFTKGVGVHKDKLASFEAALRNAGIEKCNLVYVSSIFPPKCKLLTSKEGIQCLRPGEITHCVMARIESNEPNRMLAASVGFAIPRDSNSYGYLSEHHSYGHNEKVAGDYAEDLAATMLATTLGIKFDVNTAWDERKKLFRMGGQFLRASNVTQATRVDKNGRWTNAIAAAVFVNDEH